MVVSWLRRGVTGAGFLIPALALAVPSGYSWGALLLCVCAVGLLLTVYRTCKPTGVWLVFAVAVGLLSLIYATNANTDQGWLWNGLDRPLKFWLALLAMAAVVHSPVAPHVLKWGIWLGSLGAGATAAHQMMWRGMPRAEGYTNAIQFGDIALLFGLWSWAWAYQDSGRTRWLGWLAGFSGIYACAASQSRGGWVVAPVLLALLVWSQRATRHTARPWAQRVLLGGGGFLASVLALTLAFQVPIFKERVTAVVHEIEFFQQDQGRAASAETSVGQRLAHWRLAFQMGLDKPLLGWGEEGYKREKRRRTEAGEAPPILAEFGHAHNDWLEVWVKYGVVGMLVLGFVLGSPGVAYWRVLRQPPTSALGAQGQRRAVAVCGLLLVVGYVGFGQTQVMFAHNSGTMVYLFMNLLFLSVCATSNQIRPEVMTTNRPNALPGGSEPR